MNEAREPKQVARILQRNPMRKHSQKRRGKQTTKKTNVSTNMCTCGRMTVPDRDNAIDCNANAMLAMRSYA